MSDLKNILRLANVQRAAIIDDAYELVPLAKDLSIDDTSWVEFFEDINDDDRNLIRALFPSFDNFRGDELRNDDVFVASLWNGQAKLRSEIITPLFERFKRDKQQDLAYLDVLTKRLESYDVRCVPAGRDFESVADGADLIVIDLYLDSAQDDAAMQSSIDGLKKVIQKRVAKPPLVVLMSRSARLEQKREEFRDNSGLFESAFRIIRKTELGEEGKLSRLLTRLAEHYRDSLKLAAFIHAWQLALGNACARTAKLIRTLDLADIAQIRQLLLTEEGEQPGSYLVDVFDAVLQHEVERENVIIEAAIDLNKLDGDAYPPPYVAGSPDLQALVYRSLFHNIDRLKLRNVNASPVLFGDVLRRKPAVPAPASASKGVDPATNAEATAPDVNSPFGDMGPSDVFIVMTPACDLQRLSAKRVLLLKGTLIPLTPANWSYDEAPIRTSVFEASSKERFQIKWELKHIETVSYDLLKVYLDASNGIEVVARLREAPSLELQQKLLSNLGRVGIIAPMPATFPVNIEAYLPDVNKKLFKVEVPELTKNQGVCFIGRKEKKQAKKLVLCEDACEALCGAVQSIKLDLIHLSTQETVQALRSSDELLILQKGVDVSALSENTFCEIIILVPAVGEKPEEKRTIGLIRRSGAWINEPLNGGYLKKAGIILVVTD